MTLCDSLSDLQQVGVFFLGTQVSSANKTEIYVESGVKHHNPNPPTLTYKYLIVITGIYVKSYFKLQC